MTRRRAIPLRALAALLGLAAGCSYSVERAGDDRFLTRPVPRVAGVTTAVEVAQAIGPPDEIRTVGEDLWFVYRCRRATRAQVALHYYLDLVKASQGDETVGSLIVVFDRADRVRSVAMDRSPWAP